MDKIQRMRNNISKYKLMEKKSFVDDLEELINNHLDYIMYQEECRKEAMNHRSMMRDLMGDAMTDEERSVYY